MTTSRAFDLHYETFDDPDLVKAKAAAETFVAAIERWNTKGHGRAGDVANVRPHWLTLIGKSGTGKTHLGKRIAAYWHKHGRWYEHPTTTANLVRTGSVRDWAKCISEIRDGEYRLVDDIISDDFVMLDDIGAENATEFTASKLLRILNERLGKWTVITANLTVAELASVDARLASRLFRDGNVVVQINATDYALRQRRAA